MAGKTKVVKTFHINELHICLSVLSVSVAFLFLQWLSLEAEVRSFRSEIDQLSGQSCPKMYQRHGQLQDPGESARQRMRGRGWEEEPRFVGQGWVRPGSGAHPDQPFQGMGPAPPGAQFNRAGQPLQPGMPLGGHGPRHNQHPPGMILFS